MEVLIESPECRPESVIRHSRARQLEGQQPPAGRPYGVEGPVIDARVAQVDPGIKHG